MVLVVRKICCMFCHATCHYIIDLCYHDHNCCACTFMSAWVWFGIRQSITNMELVASLLLFLLKNWLKSKIQKRQTKNKDVVSPKEHPVRAIDKMWEETKKTNRKEAKGCTITFVICGESITADSSGLNGNRWYYPN